MFMLGRRVSGRDDDSIGNVRPRRTVAGEVSVVTVWLGWPTKRFGMCGRQ
jgi:hypothetical protein